MLYRRVHRLPRDGGFAAQDAARTCSPRSRTAPTRCRSASRRPPATPITSRPRSPRRPRARDVKKLKVVVFGSGGEAMTALLGGHVGLVVTPSANVDPAPAGGPHARARGRGAAAPRAARSRRCRRGRNRAPTSSSRTGARSSGRRGSPRRRSRTGKAAFAKLLADRRMEERGRARRRASATSWAAASSRPTSTRSTRSSSRCSTDLGLAK